MEARRFFSRDDLARIEAAIRRAEESSRGEVVTVAVAASDAYEGAAWRGASMAAVFASFCAAVTHAVTGQWGGNPLIWAALPTAVGALAGYLLVDRLSALRRLLVSPEVMEARVHLRATAAFVDHEVFKTRDRSGVLLFLSLFEHRVVVLGDEGINAVVADGEWQSLVDALSARLRSGEVALGLEEAIAHCGRMISRVGLEPRRDDQNELPDGLRLEDVDGTPLGS